MFAALYICRSLVDREVVSWMRGRVTGYMSSYWHSNTGGDDLMGSAGGKQMQSEWYHEKLKQKPDAPAISSFLLSRELSINWAAICSQPRPIFKLLDSVQSHVEPEACCNVWHWWIVTPLQYRVKLGSRCLEDLSVREICGLLSSHSWNPLL